MVLRTALTLATLPLFTRARVDVARNWRRSDEADGTNFWMVDQRIDYSLAPIDETDHAFRQSGFFQQLVHVAHRERDALTRFQNKCVSCGDGVGQIPEGNHARKIKRHDRGGNADGLANHHLVDAASDVFEVVALHHHRDAAGHFHIFDGATHLSFGFGEGLAILRGDDASDVVDVLLEQHLELEERLDAIFGRSAAPFRESAGCGFDGHVDFGGVGERDAGQDFAGRRIHNVAPFGRVRLGPLAVDVVREFGDGRCCYRHGVMPLLSRRISAAATLHA